MSIPAAPFACALFVAHGASVLAQAPSVEEVLHRAKAAYGHGPFAERLDIEAVDDAGRVERSAITVRVQPSALSDAAGTPAILSIAIDLNRLRLWAGPGQLIATRAQSGEAWWGADAPESGTIEMLESTLPPLTLPSVAILCGSSALTPLTPSIIWTSVSEDPSGAGWLLVGQAGPSEDHDDHAVQAAFDRESSRLTRLVVSGPGASGLERLSIIVTPIDPGEPSAWRPATAAAHRRETLAALIETRIALGVGDRFPSVVWVREDGGAWRLQSGESTPGGPVPLTAFILFRVTGASGETGQILADVRACAHVLSATVRERNREGIVAGGSGTAAPRVVPGAVFTIESFDPERFAEFARELSGLAAEEPGVVWTSPATATLDAMSVDARSMLCIVDARGEIVAMAPIDGLADAPDAERERLAQAIGAAYSTDR